MPLFALGDQKIKHLPLRMLAAVMAPLVLGGCGLPVGVQIASLFADGISLLTTEKTLTDHGISAITSQDCAVWRGIKGEEVCQDKPFDPDEVAGLEDSPLEEYEDSAEDGEETAGNTAEDTPTAEPGPPGPVVKSFALAANTDTAAEDAPAQDAPAAAPAAAPVTADRPKTPEAPAPGHYHAKAKGGAFYVIASYRRLGYARRFVQGQSEWVTKIIAGTASGRAVYRVAIGPVTNIHRRYVRTRLIKDGYPDVWMLRLKNPKVVVELAALN
jgi:GNAT superfamily N-acetyltransferase